MGETQAVASNGRGGTGPERRQQPLTEYEGHESSVNSGCRGRNKHKRRVLTEEIRENGKK